MPYFQVTDCDATASKAKELGGNVMVPPTDLASVSRFAVVSDPQGATFAIFKPRARKRGHTCLVAKRFLQKTTRCQDGPTACRCPTRIVNKHRLTPPFPDGLARALFRMGCFWGAERSSGRFRRLQPAVGYAAGHTPNPRIRKCAPG